MCEKPTKEELAVWARALSNREIIERTASAVHEAAVMANFRSYTGLADDRADALYDEARRRGNVDLYQRGFNIVARENGHGGMCGKVSTPIEVGEELQETVPA